MSTSSSSASDRRRLAPRTSEDEALFIANKYAQNKLILEAKLANSLNGGRMVRQTMLDDVANELSVKFNVAARSRKYVEQKLRDMKKEARKFFYLQQNAKPSENGSSGKSGGIRAPPEPIRVMIEAMADELRAGAVSDELDVYGKLKSDRLDIDVERDDFPSHQSAASTSGESVGGAPASDHGGANDADDARTNGLDDANSDADLLKGKCSAVDSLTSSWQSLTALMLNLSAAAGVENFPFTSGDVLLSPVAMNGARNGHPVSGKSKNGLSQMALTNGNGANDFFATALRQLTDGAMSSGSGASEGTMTTDTSATVGDEANAREFIKALTASSLFLPGFYMLPPSNGGSNNAADSPLLANALFNAMTLSAGVNNGGKASFTSNSSHRSHACHKHRDDVKNVSNPCSPFSPLVSSTAESPRLASGFNVDADFSATTLKNSTSQQQHTKSNTQPATAEITDGVGTSKTPSTTTPKSRAADIGVDAATRPRRFFNSARFRHSVMRRLQAVSNGGNEPASKILSSACLTNGASDMSGERLGVLKRQLILEEINASRAFTTLCVEARKSIDEAVKSFVETHRLHARLLRAQLAALPAENGDDHDLFKEIIASSPRDVGRARKRKNPSAAYATTVDSDEDTPPQKSATATAVF